MAKFIGPSAQPPTTTDKAPMKTLQGQLPAGNRALYRSLLLAGSLVLLCGFFGSHNALREPKRTAENPLRAMQMVDLVIDTTLAVAPASVGDYVHEYPEEDLRRALATAFPYDRDSQIPKCIWQIWKEPLNEIKNTEIRNYLSSWAAQDGYQYNLILDDEIDGYVAELYGGFPEVVEAFELLPINILKYDFFRYLMLYAKGGTYSDVDAHALKSLHQWADNKAVLSKLYDIGEQQIGLVVGVEGDLDREDWRFKIARRVQFCQWTFKSKKGHPLLRELIHKIVKLTLEQYSPRLNHVKIGTQYYTLHSIYTVLEWTGPGIFTDAVYSHLNKIFANASVHNCNKPAKVKFTEFDTYHKEKNSVSENKPLGWESFTGMTQPLVMDDVLLLPINSFNGFADGVEFEVDEQWEYVKHEFQGSWKDTGII